MKSQISLGICPVWSEFAVRMKKACVFSYPLSAQRRLIRLCLRWVHMPFCCFFHEAVQIHLYFPYPIIYCPAIISFGHRTRKPTKWPVHQWTQISLGIHPVWSVFILRLMGGSGPNISSCGQRDFDQTGWMPRLIWVFAGRTGHFVGFVLRQLILFLNPYLAH